MPRVPDRTRSRAGIAKRRRFEGDLYRYATARKRKPDAKHVAQEYRAHGYRARVVKYNRKNVGRGIWLIYVRKDGRGSR